MSDVNRQFLLAARPVGMVKESDLQLNAAPVPEPGEGEVRCLRSGRVGQRMRFNPFDDAIGDFIYEKISQESWEGWMEMSIKVINELRLDLGDPEHQAVYDRHMRDYLNLPEDLFND